MNKSVSVFFVIVSAFLLAYAITAGVMTEFTLTRVLLCCTSTACLMIHAIILIED